MIDWYYLEKISGKSSYKPNINRLIEMENNWNEFTEIEYREILRKTRENIIDPIPNGMNYNQTDIRRHLKKLR